MLSGKQKTYEIISHFTRNSCSTLRFTKHAEWIAKDF
jgi:hypothetical protein